jgi:hypothetical protein
LRFFGIFFSLFPEKKIMAQKTTNRSEAVKKLRRYLSFSNPSKSRKGRSFFHLLNKEEDEDNEQTLWPFKAGWPISKRERSVSIQM